MGVVDSGEGCVGTGDAMERLSQGTRSLGAFCSVLCEPKNKSIKCKP